MEISKEELKGLKGKSLKDQIRYGMMIGQNLDFAKNVGKYARSGIEWVKNWIFFWKRDKK